MEGGEYTVIASILLPDDNSSSEINWSFSGLKPGQSKPAEARELRTFFRHTCCFSTVMPVHPERDGALHCNSNQISHSPTRRPSSGTEIERRPQLPLLTAPCRGRLGTKTVGWRTGINRSPVFGSSGSFA